MLGAWKTRRNRWVAARVWVVRHPIEALRWTAIIKRGGQPYAATPDLPLAAWNLMRQAGVSEARFERDGIVWWADVGDEIGRSLLCHGGYQAAEIQAVLGWMTMNRRSTRARVVVDVGANLGTTTIPFAQAGYRVVAVEPVPRTFQMLAANVADNGLSELITCVNAAITESTGSVLMWTGGGSGQSEVVIDGEAPARWASRSVTDSVRSIPLTSMLNEQHVLPEDVALVWSDAQGSETSVITTAPELWASGVPLYLEVWPSGVELHGGLGTFVDEVAAHFAHFLSRDDLLCRRDPTPIGEFAAWVGTIREGHTDALLLP